MCRALMVSPAGYYAWAGRPESDRSVHNRALLSAIRVIHRESRETYGSPHIWDALVKRGHGVGENRIARLMRAEGIRAKTVKKWRATTQNRTDHVRPTPDKLTCYIQVGETVSGAILEGSTGEVV